MGILDKLSDPAVWARFREYKSARGNISDRDLARLDAYIAEEKYRTVTDRIGKPDHGFSFPSRRVINKSGSSKKRVIYTFPADEVNVLKLLSYLLYRYDGYFSPSCYSFRRNLSAKDAIDGIIRTADPGNSYVLKADVHDYFNSIPAESLVAVFRDVVTDDDELLAFLSDFFTADLAWDGDRLVPGNRGAMAGVPLSAFSANVYLTSLDRLFGSLGVPYFRYSDDILIFADSAEKLEEYRRLLTDHLTRKGLELNPDKVTVTAPGEPWEFLGFKYTGGRFDLSDAAVRKMKDKMRRKCRALYRWRVRKDVDFERAAKVVVRIFNRKFYDDEEYGDFTWSRWFFPVLTTDEGLRELDRYFAENLRYIYSGRHYKGNYAVTYEKLKSLGYRSLVHEYYEFRKKI